MNNDKIEKFKEKYCLVCGSQRCTGEDEWLEGCTDYRQYMENPDKPNALIIDHLDYIDVNARIYYPHNRSKYVLIDEMTKVMIDYCKKNHVVLSINGKPLFEE